jgi:hypothetical protein
MISSPGCVCLGAAYPGSKFHAHLDHLAPDSAEIVPLQVRSFGSRLLSDVAVRSHTSSGDQHRYSHDSCRCHVPFAGRTAVLVRPAVRGSMVSYRNDLNAARNSVANSSGYSHIAKWPPRSTSWK